MGLSLRSYISNQTAYAHEILAVFDAAITGETIKNCHSFVSDSGNVWPCNNITIAGNTVVGTGHEGEAYVSNQWMITSAGIVDKKGWNIVGNTFVDPRNINGVVRVPNAVDLVISGNQILSNQEDDGITLCNITGTTRSVVRNNKWIRTANYTASHPAYNSRPQCISCGLTSVDALIEGNDLTMAGTAAGDGILAIGEFAGATAYPRITINRNRISGTWDRVISLNDSGASLEIHGNDLRNATITSIGYFVGSTTKIFQQNVYSGTAAPTIGAFERGDIVWNRSPTTGNPTGWMCTATGTPGTWKAMANLL